MRILYSFGMKLGAPGVGYAAKAQIQSYLDNGCEVEVFTARSVADLPPEVVVHKTTQVGRVWLPQARFAMKWSFRLHDWIVARAVRRRRGRVDVVHTWPGSSRRTLIAARQTGALAVREACNCHIAYGFEVVAAEHKRLGVPLAGSDATNAYRVRTSEAEYEEADLILAPSEFAVQTFTDRGVPKKKLAIKRYGFDPDSISMDPDRDRGKSVTFAFVGRCEPRKGLHYALEAWHKSGVADCTSFLILGEFVPGYREVLADMLDHPNIEILGFVSDLRPVYARMDALVLPSIEEGSALVTYDAQGAGSTQLVSRAAGARLTDGVEGLLHEPGDVDTLAAQMRFITEDPEERRRMQRAASLNSKRLTWDAATQDLIGILEDFRNRHVRKNG